MSNAKQLLKFIIDNEAVMEDGLVDGARDLQESYAISDDLDEECLECDVAELLESYGYSASSMGYF